MLVASGVSCRHQVEDFTGARALHAAELISSLLAEPSLNLAVISVAALAIAIIVSCVTTLNVGVLAIALAWIVGRLHRRHAASTT